MSMLRGFLVVVCALAFASSAFAQMKVSGTLDCNKAEPSHVIPIPDREGFAFGMGQNKCSWLKGGGVEGLQPAEFTNTTFLEVTGATALITSIGVSRYSTGDAVYSRSTGTRDGKALTTTGKWTYTHGTGKLAGIKGAGTYACKIKSAEPGAGYTCEVAGTYSLPAAKK